MLLSAPSKEEVKDTIGESNLNAAPGTDGLTSFFYKECFNIMGDALTEVVSAVFCGDKPSCSQRTSLMVFGSKPKKSKSIKPGDKRRISLLNADFKTISGLVSRRLKKTATRTLSPYQLVAGDDRRIHHGINLARDAIQSSSKFKKDCAIIDTDYMAAFDFLVMSWVFQVLEKKGLSQAVIQRLQNLYSDNISIVVVNNIYGKSIQNKRLSLRQGDVPSMFFFAYGIDPLITFLEKRLTGILITSIPVSGPSQEHSDPPSPIEERYKVISYADDLKPAVTSIEEILLVDKASAMFEAASGCILHRDPASQKCKLLPLGKWKTSLNQDSLPPSCNYMVISDHLDMVGVELRSTWTQTRKANGDIIQKRLSDTINPWKSGKFMPLTSRPWSINSFALSKVWFKCSSVDLRVGDLTAISSSLKSWLYADMLEKPSEAVLYRPISYGGLGVLNPKYRALASLIRSFMETAANPKFRRNHYHEQLYRFHVLEESDLPDPGFPPYYSPEFFSMIKKAKNETPLNVTTMSISQWSRLLVEDNLTMFTLADHTMEFIPCKAELASPSTDWQHTWHLARLKGLGPDNTSFLWKLLHQLLPVKERLHRLSPITPPYCTLCDQLMLVEDIKHIFYDCTHNVGAGLTLVVVLKDIMPDITIEKILRLEFTELEEDLEYPAVWFTAAFLLAIWEKRTKGLKIRKYEIRAEIESKVSLLRETRFKDYVAEIQILCEKLPVA